MAFGIDGLEFSIKDLNSDSQIDITKSGNEIGIRYKDGIKSNTEGNMKLILDETVKPKKNKNKKDVSPKYNARIKKFVKHQLMLGEDQTDNESVKLFNSLNEEEKVIAIELFAKLSDSKES